MAEQQMVSVYYCACGKSIERAGDEKYFDRATKKEYKQAKDWGRKTESITLEEFHKTPFMCGDGSIVECINKTTEA